MIRFFATLTLFFLLGFNAYAWKGLSGGNISAGGAGGTVLDRSAYDTSTRLDGGELLKLFQKEYAWRIGQLPYIANISALYLTGDHAKLWYLEDRRLARECLDQIPIRTAIKIAACQNDVEVRFDRKIWRRLSDQEKATLILHEIVTALGRNSSDVSQDAVIPATHALLDKNTSPRAVQSLWSLMKLPVLPTGDELAGSQELLRQFNTETCEISSDGSPLSNTLTQGQESTLLLKLINEPRPLYDAASDAILGGHAYFTGFWLIQQEFLGPAFCESNKGSDRLQFYLWKGWQSEYASFF